MATSRLRAGVAVLVLGMLGCSTMQPPARGWVTDSPAARTQTMGATVSITYRDRHGRQQALGELIAIDADEALVLSATELSTIPLDQMTHYELIYRDASHGTTTLVGARLGMKQKAFARFPQGVPDRVAFQQGLTGPASGAPDSLKAQVDSLKR